MTMIRKRAVVLTMMLLFALALPKVWAKELTDVHMQGVSDKLGQYVYEAISKEI